MSSKRYLGIVALIGLGFASLAWAQDADEAAPAAEQTIPASSVAGPWGPAFVDENGDGICDRYQDGTWQGRRGRGYGPGMGPAFVDEDGDGVCDYYQDGAWQGGRGRGNGLGYGRGMGPAFVDEDGNGVCDYYEDGSRPGRRGRGNGWGRRRGRQAPVPE